MTKSVVNFLAVIIIVHLNHFIYNALLKKINEHMEHY